MLGSKSNYQNEFYRESDSMTQKGIPAEEVSSYYYNREYETYLAEYVGDFTEHLSSIDYAKFHIISPYFTLFFVKEGMLSKLLKEIPEIINIERNFPFTLFSLKESNEAPNLKAVSKGSTTLDGKGMVVGIIGTGIDYLNPRFMDEAGNTRIIAIYDQTVDTGPMPKSFFLGTEYTREDINKAIEVKNKGNNPYDIVNHRDETGYGTSVATIIGGRSLGDKDEIASFAPSCEFIIVKLKEACCENLAHWGVENYKGSVYDSHLVATSIRYLYQTHQTVGKPFVIYLSAGTNLGAHDGSTMGERYLNFFTQGRGFYGVMSTGDQGSSPICLKRNFEDEEIEKTIEINVDEEQQNFFFSLYYGEPDVITVGITNPIGETIDKIPINQVNGEEANFTLGKSSIYCQYFLENKVTLGQRIDIVIKNAIGGIWKINIKKETMVRGTINTWFQQKEFSVGKTGLVKSTPYTTLMTPATANNVIVNSSFNEIEYIVMEDSGRGFTTDNRINPSIAVASQNILTVGLNNKPIVVSGSAVSGAILTGVTALLVQWGIVEQNDLNMYSSKIKNYLIQGTVKDESGVYPNQETGFGVLNIEKVFNNLKKRQSEYNEEIINNSTSNNKEKYSLYINIPEEIYNTITLISYKRKRIDQMIKG
ncbi:S8 family peptidase [Clostridium sp. UBA4548]|uniref:S8 family peptidase n=1 Tax=Clostridium sp. UBA4548 TaxID=1946361 RepID=UPI0025B7F8F1|nr:S8 family peptidase [Clostridium sp. UBA4548]